MTAASMITACSGPTNTSAMTTANAPDTIAPTTGMKDARNTRTAMGIASGRPSSHAAMPMPTALPAATKICTRVNAESVPQPARPAPSIAGRARRGKTETTKRQMPRPSMSTMTMVKKARSAPVTRWPTPSPASSAPVRSASRLFSRALPADASSAS